MDLQDLGAIGELVGGAAVVVSLIYVAWQIRQSSHQIEQNTRYIEASMYHATNDDFFRWFALMAQDAELADLWSRGLRGDRLSDEERMRFHAIASTLFLAYENNYQQLQLGAVKRPTLEIASADIARLLTRPAMQQWWERRAAHTLSPEFRAAIESLREKHGRSEPGRQ